MSKNSKSMPIFKEYFKIVNSNRELVEQFSSTIVKYLEDDNARLQSLTQLKSVLETSIKDSSLIESGNEILMQLDQETDDSTNNNGADAFVKGELEYKNLIAALDIKEKKKQLFEADPTMKKLTRTLQLLHDDIEDDEAEENSDEEDEVQATQQEINLIDPISKSLMKHPVQHIICGHVYDRDSLLQMMKMNRRKGFSCPTMGCTSRVPIEKRNLEDAVSYIREIQKRKRNGTYKLD